jgi:hypothetical protein
VALDLHNRINITMENLRLLYEPIILEASLNEAFRKQQLGLEPPPPEEHNPFQPESDAFKCFANKLAQICDNERGGDTVTAIAVLVGEDGPQYVLGSNAKNEGQIINTENFLGQLLKYVIETMDDSKRTQKNVAKKALWRILKFNQGRVRLYSDQLTKTLDECIDQLDHEAQEFNEKKSQDEPSLQVSMVQPDMPLRDELKALKSKATFAIDFTTSNAEDKCKSPREH